MRFFARALRRRGHDVETRTDLAALGFFVCEDDLEDELIRALGTDAVIEVVAREGELGLLHTFQQQPAQRGRSLHDQLHRFFGTKSGRKVRLATALAARARPRPGAGAAAPACSPSPTPVAPLVEEGVRPVTRPGDAVRPSAVS